MTVVPSSYETSNRPELPHKYMFSLHTELDPLNSRLSLYNKVAIYSSFKKQALGFISADVLMENYSTAPALYVS